MKITKAVLKIVYCAGEAVVRVLAPVHIYFCLVFLLPLMVEKTDAAVDRMPIESWLDSVLAYYIGLAPATWLLASTAALGWWYCRYMFRGHRVSLDHLSPEQIRKDWRMIRSNGWRAWIRQGGKA